MGSQNRSISSEELDHIALQCTALHQDWQRFRQLATAPPATAQSERELALIQLQSRLSCDYPILSNARQDQFGLASRIGKLVAHAGSMSAFAREAQAGSGPLFQEWKDVNEAIERVCGMLERARADVRAGKAPKLPKELAPAVARDPLPVRALMRKAGIVCAVLCACGLLFLIFKPFILETALFKWLDKSYTAWQIYNGVPIPGAEGKVPPAR